MKILKRLGLFAVFVVFVLSAFVTGVWTGTASIQRSCDNVDESRTVINGHTYFCHDYDAVNRAFSVLLQQRGGA